MEWAPRAPSAGPDLDDERIRFWHAIEANGNRIDGLERDMHQTVTRAVKDAMPTALLSDDEHRWIQLAIKQKTQSIEFRPPVSFISYFIHPPVFDVLHYPPLSFLASVLVF